ncbi:MAG: hypothetical protein HQL20_00285 [Candidatus Omnitrophica bacterium]|nr:hypothetical protein [Candidatus Omnitrophota bacterium]
MAGDIYWGFVAVVSATVGLLTVLPEIYAWLKAPSRWTPVNSPPYMLGDDYHYFAQLNDIHRKCLNFFYGTRLSTRPLTALFGFQLAGYFFNLLPYHIGFLLGDRRLGVLVVRVWNRSLLGLATAVFAKGFFLLIGVTPTTGLLILVFLVFFIFFPGPFELGGADSIVMQMENSRHIYDRSNANDLTRGMFSETTAPLLLSACAVLTLVIDVRHGMVVGILGLFCLAVLFFHYFPAAVVFAWLLFLIFLVKHYFLLAFACGLLTIGLSCFSMHMLSRSDIGKELFVQNAGTAIFSFRRSSFIGVAFTLCLALLLVFSLPVTPQTSVLVLYLGSVFFLAGLFFVKHQAIRFWSRGAVIPFEVMSTVVLATIALPLLTEGFISVFILVCFGILVRYYYRQAFFLYHVGATLLADGIEFDRDICPRDAGRFPARSRLVATNSTALADCICVFSADETYLRNYSIQSVGYRGQVRFFCANFKVLGISFAECERWLAMSVEYKDWLFARPFQKQTPFAELCYAHTLQYMVSNREYNQALLRDGMHDGTGWTPKYRDFLRETWGTVDLSMMGDVVGVVVERPY